MIDQSTIEVHPILADRFEALQLLGSGRTSTVVRARRRSDQEEVALKILHPHLVERGAVRRRLRREVAAVRRLRHPAVVAVQELVEEQDCVALVMEYIAGETVRQRVERAGPMTWEEAREVLDGVLGAVHHAHQAGILHRDLNANHILIDDGGRGRIVGFGLARVDEMAALTMHTQVLGSLEAMAPERLLGMDYDGRADIYSVGAVAHELLVGRPPGDGSLHQAFLGAEARPDLDGEESALASLEEQARYVLERALVADDSARFATALQMRRALNGHYDEELWRSWAARETEHCPSCEMPVVDGIDSCVHCGHEFRRLVQQPGRGQWMIQILSHREAFEPDVWFEQNTEPDHLREECFRGLMELLEAYEDTRPLADWDVAYRWPPYVLFHELTASDARRIGELLEEIGVPHRVAPWRPTRWRRLVEKADQRLRVEEFLESEELDDQADKLWWEKEYSGSEFINVLAWLVREFQFLRRPVTAMVRGGMALFYLIFLAPWLFVINLNRREFAMIAAAVGFVVGFWFVLAPARGISPPTAAAALGSFGLGLVMTRVMGPILKRRIGVQQERPTIAGQPLMITAEKLARVDTAGGAELLPDRVGQVLNECKSDEVRREIHELIVLAVNVARRTAILDHPSFQAVVEEILTAGERLDKYLEQARARPTAERYDELESLELKLEEADDEERDALKAQREESVAAMAAHDEILDEVTALRTTLQLARGRLFDLLGAVDPVDDEEVVLQFNEGPEVELTRLSHELAARAEVAELVGASTT